MIYRYQPRTIRREPEPLWVRHPHIGGFVTFFVVPAIVIGLVTLIPGCDDFWRCRAGWDC